MTTTSPRLKARIAGIFYVLNGGSAFAFVVRSRLSVRGDAVATAERIASHEPLYRSALAADIAGLACYIVVTALLYELLRPVNRSVSLIAALLSFVGCCIQLMGCVFHLGALVALGRTPRSPETIFLLARLQRQAFTVGIAFFGFYCLLLGWLIFRSTFLPRAIGILVAIAGAAYVASEFSGFLELPFARVVDAWVPTLAALGELPLMIWLIAVGLNAERWRAVAAQQGGHPQA